MFSSRPLLRPVASSTASNFERSCAERDVAAQRHARVQRDAQRQDVVDLHLDDFARKPEMRNAQVEHAARDRRGLEDLHRVPQQRQVVRAGQAAHARSHNGDSLARASAPAAGLLRAGSCPVPEVVAVGGVALERADGDRLVDLAAPAGVLARVRADPAQHVGERIGSAGQQVGLFVPARSRWPARTGRTRCGSGRRCGTGYSGRSTPGPEPSRDSAWRLPPLLLGFQLLDFLVAQAGKKAFGFLSFRSVWS